MDDLWEFMINPKKYIAYFNSNLNRNSHQRNWESQCNIHKTGNHEIYNNTQMQLLSHWFISPW